MTVIHHSINLRDRIAMAAMRLMLPSSKNGLTKATARQEFDELMEKVADADGVSYAEGSVGGVAGWWCRPKAAAADAAVLYLHGGAYILGSASAYRHFAGQIAARTATSTFVPDYALAPERPFPSAVNEALSVYDGLVDQGMRTIALAGDSAGGGLTLVLLAIATEKARGGSRPRPVGAAVISAWTDLALTGTSLATREAADPLLTKDELATCARLYLGGHDARDTRASPIYGDLGHLPPVRMHVGEDEVLIDDSLRYAERLEKAGGLVEVHTWQGMVHVFPSNIALLKAAPEALDNIAEFLRRQLAPGSTATQQGSN